MRGLDQDLDVAKLPAPNRRLLEQGTWRVLIGFAIVMAIYYGYLQIHATLLDAKKWPPLSPPSSGLFAIGLLDRPGNERHNRYIAVFSSYECHIRRPEESTVPSDNRSSELKGEQVNNPGGGHSSYTGADVPLSDVLKHCPVVLTQGMFTHAWVQRRTDAVFARTYYIVHVDLSDEGRSRYYQFSSHHAGEHLVFILNNQILTAAKMQVLDTTELQIEPFWFKSDANRLADYINAHPG